MLSKKELAKINHRIVTNRERAAQALAHIFPENEEETMAIFARAMEILIDRGEMDVAQLYEMAMAQFVDEYAAHKNPKLVVKLLEFWGTDGVHQRKLVEQGGEK